MPIIWTLMVIMKLRSCNSCTLLTTTGDMRRLEIVLGTEEAGITAEDLTPEAPHNYEEALDKEFNDEEMLHREAPREEVPFVEDLLGEAPPREVPHG